MKVAIVTGDAPSLKVVSETIAYVLRKKGDLPIVLTQFYPDMVLNKNVDAIIFNYPADPTFCRSYAGYYATYKTFFTNMHFYTTIEGKPHRQSITAPMWRYVDFIANSRYTATKLIEAGLKVRDIVPHGLNFEAVESAKTLVPEMRKRVENVAKDKVTFLYVGSTHPRKNLDGLVQAVQILRNKGRDDFIVLAVTKDAQLTDGMMKWGEFGKLSYTEVLALMGAVDFFITPTKSEGFCLPVLEAMAMEKVCLHGNFAPLNEFSDPSANITWPSFGTVDFLPEEPGSGAIMFELNQFEPSSIAEAMETAIDMKKNSPKEYEDRCKKNGKIAKKYDAMKVYSYFHKIIRQ